MSAFETYILHRCNLDIYSCCSRSFNFCHDCWTCVSGGREPKFGISNKMSKLCCQYYPTPLENLTSAEEAVIARAHPVVAILKLSRGHIGAFADILFFCPKIRGHCSPFCHRKRLMWMTSYK